MSYVRSVQAHNVFSLAQAAKIDVKIDIRLVLLQRLWNELQLMKDGLGVDWEEL